MLGIERTASVPAMIVFLVMAYWFRQEEKWEEFRQEMEKRLKREYSMDLCVEIKRP